MSSVNSVVYQPEDLIGKEVKIKSLTMQNSHRFLPEHVNKIFKIKDFHFRLSIDGKCITIVELEDFDCCFTLEDLLFVDKELYGN